MKCKNVKKFREVRVKPFKYTCEKVSNLSSHLVNTKVIVVGLCDDKEHVYVKLSLKEHSFYRIHRKDLKNTR
jgi:hypothetical protein